MIPQFYINLMMGEWIYSNYYQKNYFKYDPLIIHFSSKTGKTYLKLPKFNNLECSAQIIPTQTETNDIL